MQKFYVYIFLELFLRHKQEIAVNVSNRSIVNVKLERHIRLEDGTKIH